MAAIAAMFGGGARVPEDPVKLDEDRRARGHKPRPGERPSTTPKHIKTDEFIVEKRREKNFVRAAYRARYGRRMNARQWRKLRRDPAALEQLLGGGV